MRAPECSPYDSKDGRTCYLLKDVPQRAEDFLNHPSRAEEVIAVVSLLDLHGPTIYPIDKQRSSEKFEWAKQSIEGQVNHPRFRQFFAVHEVEAWLLSEPHIFPNEVAAKLRTKCEIPESVNDKEPPAELIERLFRTNLKRSYKKVRDGSQLFTKFDPSMAYAKCPYLKSMLDEMLNLAHEAGL